MAAKRTIPPEEPSRDMARATAERNTVKVYLQSVLSRGGTILALDHAGHDSVVTPEEGSEGLPRPHQPKPKNGEVPPPLLSKLFTSALLSVSGFAEKIKAEARVPLSPSLIIFDCPCRNIYSLSYMYMYQWFCYKELWWVLGLILWKIIPVLNQWENEPKIENAWAFMKPDSHRLQNSVLQYTKIKM